MNREAILEICGVKEVFEVPQALMKKLFSPEQSDLLNRIAVIYGDSYRIIKTSKTDKSKRDVCGRGVK